jgi:hypothetical protein
MPACFQGHMHTNSYYHYPNAFCPQFRVNKIIIACLYFYFSDWKPTDSYAAGINCGESNKEDGISNFFTQP